MLHNRDLEDKFSCRARVVSLYLFHDALQGSRAFLLQEQRSLKAGDLSHQETNNMAASTMKLQSDSFSSEKVSRVYRSV